MAKDKFAAYADVPGRPAASLIEIVPDDEADLPHVLSGLNVATPGTVRVTTKDGSTGTVFVEAGTVLPLRITRVWATDTTATGLRGLY